MRIPSESLIPPLPDVSSKHQLLQTLKPGQILQATALSENQNGRLKLQIGVSRLIAQTQVSVRPGAHLTLQVDKAGDLPLLRLLTQPGLDAQQNQALKNALPRQQPIPQLMQALIKHTSTPERDALPSEIKQAFETLRSHLPSTQNPAFKQQLKSALENSGLFTEARLLGNTAHASDLKLNLMRLFQLIQSQITQQTQTGARPNISAERQDASPGLGVRLFEGLLKQLDATLARIQTHQLASLPQDDTTRQTWQFELPILHGHKVDAWQIHIGKERASQAESHEEVWNLSLHVDLQPLGPMRIQLALQGDAISTTIWTEQATTSELVKTHLKTLRQAFERAGLEVKKLESYRSRIEEPALLPGELSLLSEKA